MISTLTNIAKHVVSGMPAASFYQKQEQYETKELKKVIGTLKNECDWPLHTHIIRWKWALKKKKIEKLSIC